jgi:hypothetical protein
MEHSIKKGERKHTGVDGKDDDRRHQDGLIHVRTDDPSSPNNDAIGDDKLTKKEFEGRCQSHGMHHSDACADVDKENGTAHR